MIIFPGNMSWLRECLDNKVGINGLDKAGNTALYWASHGGHIGNGCCPALNVRLAALACADHWKEFMNTMAHLF